MWLELEKFEDWVNRLRVLGVCVCVCDVSRTTNTQGFRTDIEEFSLSPDKNL